MKARVKATGEIVEVEYNRMLDSNGEPPYAQCDENGNLVAQYLADQLSWDVDDPDYWTRLEHQSAIAAMQGLVTRGEVLGSSVQEIARDIAEISCEVAHALVEKMKDAFKIECK